MHSSADVRLVCIPDLDVDMEIKEDELTEDIGGKSLVRETCQVILQLAVKIGIVL